MEDDTPAIVVDNGSGNSSLKLILQNSYEECNFAALVEKLKSNFVECQCYKIWLTLHDLNPLPEPDVF